MRCIPLTGPLTPISRLVLGCLPTLVLVLGTITTDLFTWGWTAPEGEQGPKPTAPEAHNLTRAFMAPKPPLEGQAMLAASPDFQV